MQIIHDVSGIIIQNKLIIQNELQFSQGTCK